MSETGNCPKCRGAMQRGYVSGDFRIKKRGDVVGDRMDILYCRECGFIEFYKEASTKEPWRWKREDKMRTAQTKKPEETPQEEATQRGRKRLIR